MKKLMITLLILGSVLLVSSVWADETITIYGSRVSQVNVDENAGIMTLSINASDVTSVTTSSSAVSDCYNASNGQYYFKASQSQSFFKEMVTIAMASNLMSQSFNVTGTYTSGQTTCDMYNIGLF